LCIDIKNESNDPEAHFSKETVEQIVLSPGWGCGCPAGGQSSSTCPSPPPGWGGAPAAPPAVSAHFHSTAG